MSECSCITFGPVIFLMDDEKSKNSNCKIHGKEWREEINNYNKELSLKYKNQINNFESRLSLTKYEVYP